MLNLNIDNNIMILNRTNPSGHLAEIVRQAGVEALRNKRQKLEQEVANSKGIRGIINKLRGKKPDPYSGYKIERINRKLAKLDREEANKFLNEGKEYIDYIGDKSEFGLMSDLGMYERQIGDHTNSGGIYFKGSQHPDQFYKGAARAADSRVEKFGPEAIESLNRPGTEEDIELAKKVLEKIKKEGKVKIYDLEKLSPIHRKIIEGTLAGSPAAAVPNPFYGKDYMYLNKNAYEHPETILHELQHILDAHYKERGAVDTLTKGKEKDIKFNPFNYGKSKFKKLGWWDTKGGKNGALDKRTFKANPDFYKKAENILDYKRNVLEKEQHANAESIKQAWLNGATPEQLERFSDSANKSNKSYEALIY